MYIFEDRDSSLQLTWRGLSVKTADRYPTDQSASRLGGAYQLCVAIRHDLRHAMLVHTVVVHCFYVFILVKWLKQPNKITKCTLRYCEKLYTTNSNIAYRNTAFSLFENRYCLVCNATDIENECTCHVNK